MGNQAGIIIRNVKNELFHSAKRLILNEVKGIECLLYLQLLKSMCKHFVEDEHYCYFDDMYSPEYTMQWIYDAIQKHDIDAESKALLTEGHKEILQTECYEDYGYPSYIG